MTGFNLSPGITPFLADAAVAVVPLLLAAGTIRGRERGLLVAWGVATLALGLVKAFTDYGDWKDALVASAGIAVGLAGILRPSVRVLPGTRFGVATQLLGGLALLVGVYKAAADFYDPFDLELAGLTVGLAAMLLASVRSGWGGPGPDSDPRTTP